VTTGHDPLVLTTTGADVSSSPTASPPTTPARPAAQPDLQVELRRRHGRRPVVPIVDGRHRSPVRHLRRQLSRDRRRRAGAQPQLHPGRVLPATAKARPLGQLAGRESVRREPADLGREPGPTTASASSTRRASRSSARSRWHGPASIARARTAYLGRRQAGRQPQRDRPTTRTVTRTIALAPRFAAFGHRDVASGNVAYVALEQAVGAEVRHRDLCTDRQRRDRAETRAPVDQRDGARLYVSRFVTPALPARAPRRSCDRQHRRRSAAARQATLG